MWSCDLPTLEPIDVTKVPLWQSKQAVPTATAWFILEGWKVLVLSWQLSHGALAGMCFADLETGVTPRND